MQPCLAVDQLQQLFGNQIKAVRVAEGLGVGAHLGQLAGGGQQGLDSFDKTVTGQVLYSMTTAAPAFCSSRAL